MYLGLVKKQENEHLGEEKLSATFGIVPHLPCIRKLLSSAVDSCFEKFAYSLAFVNPDPTLRQ